MRVVYEVSCECSESFVIVVYEVACELYASLRERFTRYRVCVLRVSCEVYELACEFSDSFRVSLRGCV